MKYFTFIIIILLIIVGCEKNTDLGKPQAENVNKVVVVSEEQNAQLDGGLESAIEELDSVE